MTGPFKARRKDLVEVECKCPFCGKKHTKKLNWAGRLPARVACPKHSPMFRETDDGELTYWVDNRVNK